MLKLAHITVAIALAAAAVPAGAISVVLGAGSQNLTLYGQGAITPGVGRHAIHDRCGSTSPA